MVGEVGFSFCHIPVSIAAHFPAPIWGAEISGTQLAEKVIEAKGVSSILNTASGLECDAVNSTSFSQLGLQRKKNEH